MKRRDRIASVTEAPCRAGCVPDCGGSPSGPRPRSRGSFSINSASPSHYGCETAEREIGAAPSQALDEERGERRHHQRADAYAAHGQPGGKAAAPHEPSLHRADGRNIGAADAKSDAQSVSRVDLGQTARKTCGGEAKPGQDHAGDGEAAGAEAIRERAADDPETEIKKAGEREHQRHRAARGSKIPLQRFDEGRKRIGAAEADKGHGERGQYDEPAMEDAGIGQCRSDRQCCLHDVREGWRRCQNVTLWNAAPARTSAASSRLAATSWIAIGNPVAEKPPGSVMVG